MKLITHHWMNVAVAAVVWSVAFKLPLVEVVICAFVAVVIDTAVDYLGHDADNGIERRAWRTHSVLTAPLWGAVIGALVGGSTLLVLRQLTPTAPSPSSLPIAVNWIAVVAAAGALGGMVHLALDAVTEHGIYCPFARRRLAGWHSANPALNGLTIMLAMITVGYVALSEAPNGWQWVDEMFREWPLLKLVSAAAAIAMIAAIGVLVKERNEVPMAKDSGQSRRSPDATAPAPPRTPRANPAPPATALAINCPGCSALVPWVAFCDQCGARLPPDNI